MSSRKGYAEEARYNFFSICLIIEVIVLFEAKMYNNT